MLDFEEAGGWSRGLAERLTVQDVLRIIDVALLLMLLPALYTVILRPDVVLFAHHRFTRRELPILTTSFRRGMLRKRHHDSIALSRRHKFTSRGELPADQASARADGEDGDGDGDGEAAASGAMATSGRQPSAAAPSAAAPSAAAISAEISAASVSASERPSSDIFERPSSDVFEEDSEASDASDVTASSIDVEISGKSSPPSVPRLGIRVSRASGGGQPAGEGGGSSSERSSRLAKKPPARVSGITRMDGFLRGRTSSGGVLHNTAGADAAAIIPESPGGSRVAVGSTRVSTSDRALSRRMSADI
jgi:hypothetical protein